jgi:oligogalacturonide lyase
MATGQVYPAEKRTFADARTGVEVTQLTAYPGNSHHLYFTEYGWYDDETKLLFSSEREGAVNLYSLDLRDGRITQMTDLAPLPLPREVEFVRACLSTTKPEAYFWYGYELRALDLQTAQQRAIWRMTDGFDVSMTSCSADGKYVYSSIAEDKSAEFPVDLLRGYVGFAETWAARPLSRVVRVAVDGSGDKTVWEENNWIGHANASPRHPHWVTFCHEGPWDKVDHRIWGLNAETGEAWKIRPKEGGEMFGHEYWHADGETVGYHGHHPDGTGFFGHIRWDNTGRVEVPFERIPSTHGHFHSNDAVLIVSDVGPTVNLWRWNGTDYGAARALCSHDSSFRIQQVHAHPRLNRAANQVIFCSDTSGHGQIYVADVGAFDGLWMTADVVGAE